MIGVILFAVASGAVGSHTQYKEGTKKATLVWLFMCFLFACGTLAEKGI